MREPCNCLQTHHVSCFRANLQPELIERFGQRNANLPLHSPIRLDQAFLQRDRQGAFANQINGAVIGASVDTCSDYPPTFELDGMRGKPALCRRGEI
jgi:hypothetical protein